MFLGLSGLRFTPWGLRISVRWWGMWQHLIVLFSTKLGLFQARYVEFFRDVYLLRSMIVESILRDRMILPFGPNK